jgi:hypothetical protein
MIEYLRSLVSRYMERWRRAEPPFDDPFIGVREPRTHGPGGRRSAASVEEPVDDLFVRAAGQSAPRAERGGRVEDRF